MPSFKILNLIKLNLYLTQHGEPILKMILLISTSEDHRIPVFRLVANTCDVDQIQY